jgi:hypothetical protein
MKTKTTKTIKTKWGRRFTAQSLARLRMGRPPTYPEARPLAERCGVSITHARHVLAGRRKSNYLMAELEKMRAENKVRKAD